MAVAFPMVRVVKGALEGVHAGGVAHPMRVFSPRVPHVGQESVGPPLRIRGDNTRQVIVITVVLGTEIIAGKQNVRLEFNSPRLLVSKHDFAHLQHGLVNLRVAHEEFLSCCEVAN